jgi:Skp family chaperone for outer membrane proteins
MRERVREAVREVRRQKNYDLVLDLAVEGAVVDADARVDITSAVLRQLWASRPVVSQVGSPK